MFELFLHSFDRARTSFLKHLSLIRSYLFNYSKKNKLLDYYGVTDYAIFFLRFNVSLIFSLIPFRLLGFLGINFYLRCIFGILFLYITFIKGRKLIPTFKNNLVFQLWFYYSLCIDERFKSLKPILRVSLFFCALSSFLFTFFLVKGGWVTCLVFFLFFSFYRALKNNFVNLTNLHCFKSLRSETPPRKYFTWLDVIENMPMGCSALFETQVTNKLYILSTKTHFQF